jgi:HSP20 family molecular chaperone IbpA
MYYSNFDRIFDDFFKDGGMYKTYKIASPNLNFKERSDDCEINQTKDGTYLVFETPGFNKNNLKVEIEDGFLHIDGMRTYKLNGEEKVKTIKKEFRIGGDYNTSSIEATIEDGLLTVFVPNYKKQEKKRISLL